MQPINLSEFSGKDLQVNILRLDKIHPVISGNKWFKLRYYFREAIEQKHPSILTFGGAWSNHIIASACMAAFYGVRSIGIIRGEKPKLLSSTLQSAMKFGMALHFIDRKSYAGKNDDNFSNMLKEKFGDPYIIPEGGAGIPGIAGSKEILALTSIKSYTHIICCMGTGTMYNGIVNSANVNQEIIGIPVLKGMKYLPDQFAENPQKNNICTIIQDYDFGGYAKKTPALIEFMNYFYQRTGIPTDFVYTGKLLWGITDLIVKNYFPKGSEILIIHSGGLQGNASLVEGTLLF